MTTSNFLSILHSFGRILYFDRAIFKCRIYPSDFSAPPILLPIDFSRLFDTKHSLLGFLHFNIYDIPADAPRLFPFASFDLDSSHFESVLLNFSNLNTPEVSLSFCLPPDSFHPIVRKFTPPDSHFDSSVLFSDVPYEEFVEVSLF